VYIPPSNREDRLDILHAVMRQHSFATLVSVSDGELVATHLPMLLRDGGPNGTLLCHLARANGQWRGFASPAEVLVLFQGPHAYISPSWYETELSVPTWNYVAVHAYGRPRLIEEPAALRRLLGAMVQEYEGSFERPWGIERLPEAYMQKQLGAIVGVEIPISRLEGKRKLSQNRSPADRAGVATALREQHEPLARAVADEMA